MKAIKKTLFTLNVDDYAPEITLLTYPLLEAYADKIDAEFHVIRERLYPSSVPPVYEKLQIYRLAQEMGNDWNIYIDSDALVHPDLFDITTHLPKDTVLHNGNDMAGNRWNYDQYFYRDGRHIGSCNWFTVASDWCVDLWKPLDDITIEEAIRNIHPIQEELAHGITPSHLIDDYTLSRNIAKYGLKFTTLIGLQRALGQERFGYLWHQYLLTREEKYDHMCAVVKEWKLLHYYPKFLQERILETAKHMKVEKVE